MNRKNLLSLHEAIVIALINSREQTVLYSAIASFISKQDLYRERKGNIEMIKQILLRTTKAKEAYHPLVEEISVEGIRLRSL